MAFSQHGILDINVQTNLLLVDATGPFNKESTEYYHQSIAAAISQFNHQVWCQLVTFHQLSLFTPEAEVILQQSLYYRKEQGLSACAVVLANINGEALVKEQMSRCYRQAGIKHQFFSDANAAKIWLNEVTGLFF